MEHKKLIFLDIDGTLVPPGSNVPPESALRAIRAAQANGHKVFLCTGRNPAMTAPLYPYGFDGAINCAGGYVTCGGTVLYDRPMSAEELEHVMHALKSHSIFCIMEAKDASFGDQRAERLLNMKLPGKLNSELLRWRRALEEDLGVVPMSQYDGRPIYKVSFLCLRKWNLRRARRLLKGQYQFVLQDFLLGLVNGELINRDFDKGQGIRRICAYLGADIADSIGFGDSMNDLQMIETAGIGVCMGNGSKKLKKCADMVCGEVDKNGLAEAFETLGLI